MKDYIKPTQQSGNFTGPVMGGINLAAYQVEIIPRRIQFCDVEHQDAKSELQRARRICRRVEDNFNEKRETVTVAWECQSGISGAEEARSPSNPSDHP